MWTDVIDLNAFYRSPLGQVARQLIRRQVRRIWPDLRGQTVVGLGYATPYLKQFQGEAERTLAVMPAHQGVTHWPREAPSLVTLSYEEALPFPDYSVDRLLLVHALENAEHYRQMMREAWRILSGSGRMLIVVPSRRGIWARRDATPFGAGKPFSVSQVQKLMRDTQFDPQITLRALYMPPVQSPFMLHAAPAWERVGERWFTRLGGVLLIEASKQIYAVTPARPAVKRKLVVLPGAVGATRSRLD